MQPELASLESIVGHEFRDRRLLERALVHSSLGTEDGVGDNETLEFLGDAVLDLAVSEALMREHPSHDEGRLSRMRASLVNATSLARVAEALDLGAWLRLGRGEEGSGGRAKTSILASCFEAVIGAVFVDAGYDAAREVVVRHLGEALAEGIPAEPDYKTELQERVQEQLKITPTYRTVDVSGPHHARRYSAIVEVAGKVRGRGEGPSRKSAEQLAAREALAELGND
jgi:ribonuclease-3